MFTHWPCGSGVWLKLSNQKNVSETVVTYLVEGRSAPDAVDVCQHVADGQQYKRHRRQRQHKRHRPQVLVARNPAIVLTEVTEDACNQPLQTQHQTESDMSDRCIAKGTGRRVQVEGRQEQS